MKLLKILTLVFCTVNLLHGQEITVKGNTRLNTDFSAFKTYSWASPDKTPQNKKGYDIYSYSEKGMMPGGSKTLKNGGTKNPARYAYSYNVIIPSSNAALNKSVTQSIREELEGRGYRQVKANPDLVVSYRVLEGKAHLKGFKNDIPTMVGGTEVREPKDTTTFVLEPGTLLISLIDRATSEVVWDGFASGLVEDDTFTNDEVKVKEAVHLIFDEFKYRGDEISTAN